MGAGRNLHELKASTFTHTRESRYYQSYDQIWVHNRTICALDALPAAHVIGQGVLVRLAPHSTAMVSIAEAASVLLGKWLSGLLWILVESIARELRAESTTTESRFYTRVEWKEKISRAEYFDIESENRRLSTEWVMRKAGKVLPKSKYIPESDEEDQDLQGIADIREEQMKSRSQLDELHLKTERILQLLEEAEDTSASNKSPPAEDHAKFYKPMSCTIHVEKMDGKWAIYPSRLTSEFHLLIDWLELALGGREFTTSSGLFSGCIRLEDDNNLSLNLSEAHGCWRKKILAGNILGPIPPTPMKPSTSGDSSKAQPFTHPFSQSKDGLILSAAALWALFDNALVRVANCVCTFQSASGDFIQCKEKSDGWFLWHTVSTSHYATANCAQPTSVSH